MEMTGHSKQIGGLVFAFLVITSMKFVLAEADQPPAAQGITPKAAASQSGETATAAPANEATKFIEAATDRLGWRKIRSLRCSTSTETIIPTPNGSSTLTMKSRTSFEAPDRAFSEMEITTNGRTSRTYKVTDGAFVESGALSPDGKRSPARKVPFDPMQHSAMMAGADPYNERFVRYENLKKVTVDGADPLFQKDDGSPLDNLDMTVLTGTAGDVKIEAFADSKTVRLAAMRIYNSGKLVGDYSHIRHEDIGQGVIYAVGYKFKAYPPAEGTDAKAPAGPTTTVTVSDVELNPQIDPDIFKFSSDVTPAE